MARKVPTYAELLEKHEKGQHYQKVQAAKQQLQAKWARENGCPIESEHAEHYVEMDPKEREKITLGELVILAKKKGTETPVEGDENSTQESGALIA